MSVFDSIGFAAKPTVSHGVARKITESHIAVFGSPYLVVDDVLPADLIEQINLNWPDPSQFDPETPGIEIAHIFRHDYPQYAPFWKSFNEDVFPWICAGVCSALSPYLTVLFGENFYEDIEFGAPMSLMQANAEYVGHPLHTHFYHNPDWIFTILFYVDPDDTRSNGTNLHYLHGADVGPGIPTNYPAPASDWTIDTAMRTFEWVDGTVVDDPQEVPYTCNRLFTFLDGPLAFHSVTPPAEPWDAGQSRRRILRCHMKVDTRRVFDRYKTLTDAKISAKDFHRIMGPPLEQRATDPFLREGPVRDFFAERTNQYSDIIANPDAGEKLAPEVLHRMIKKILP